METRSRRRRSSMKRLSLPVVLLLVSSLAAVNAAELGKPAGPLGVSLPEAPLSVAAGIAAVPAAPQLPGIAGIPALPAPGAALPTAALPQTYQHVPEHVDNPALAA